MSHEESRERYARFFLSCFGAVDDEVVIDGEDAHRIVRVLRMSVGERLVLCDAAGVPFVAEILDVGRSVRLRLLERHRSMISAPVERLDITLAQALPKGAKMDFVVEKATELGVRRILPMLTERVIGQREGDARVERWRRIAREAAGQSRARRIPEIAAPCAWHQVIAGLSDYQHALLPWELAPYEPQSFRRLAVGGSLLLLIGPEGGFSHREVEEAVVQGASTLSLGSRILRTETAGMVAIALARYAAGEM